MKSGINSLDSVYHNGSITWILYSGTILFSLTMYRFIWSMEVLSRLVNSSLLLFGVLYSINSLIRKKYPRKIMMNIIIPTILIVVGMTLNIFLSSFSNTSVLASLGSVLPWVVLLMLPHLYLAKKIDVITLWKYSYYFMFVAVSLGLLDYVLIFVLKGSTSTLETPYGVFLAGKFSLFHMLNDGMPHYRFYSCFAEPGNLAMLLLPFIAYAAYNKRYVGLVILLTGFVLTNSLGGFISGLLMLVIMSYFSLKKYRIISLLFFTLSTILLYPTIDNFFSQEYEKKAQSNGSSDFSSAEQREQNIINGVLKVPYFIFNKPLGIKLSSSTSENLRNKDYVGTNFLPITYLQNGGLIAFIGYLMILYTSIKTALSIFRKYNRSPIEYKVVSLSIVVFIPFLAQRTTIWECAWFALLYAPIIMEKLRENSQRKVL